MCVGGLLCGGLTLLAVGWLSLVGDTSTPSNWSESLGLQSVGFGETGGWSSLSLKKKHAIRSHPHAMAHLHNVYCMLVML